MQAGKPENGHSASDKRTVRNRREEGVMHFVTAKGILSSKNGMNLYRGCSHGCIYCDSRSKCYHMEHAFEDIEVKENAGNRQESLAAD